jgi:hypothetical protein
MIKKCIICKKEFETRPGWGRPKKNIPLRQRNSITCSKICSKYYTNVWRHRVANKRR